MLSGGSRARHSLRRAILHLCEDDRHLLPSNLPSPATETRELLLCAHRCRRAESGLSTMPALSTGKQLRKVLKNRGHFPSDEAATKLMP
jgi:hypothetical protein